MKNHPRCRCTMIPAVRAVQVDRGADWFDQQDPETQRAILGTNIGYEKFKRGELKLEEFVGLKRDIRWGDNYYQLSVKRAVAGQGKFPGYGVKAADIIPSISQTPVVSPKAGARLVVPDQVKRVAEQYLRTQKLIPASVMREWGLDYDLRDHPADTEKVASVSISDIVLGRDNLNPEKLLKLIDSIEQRGLQKSEKFFEIDLFYSAADQRWVATGDGNHRIAVLTLAGYKGEIDAVVHYQKKDIAKVNAKARMQTKSRK